MKTIQEVEDAVARLSKDEFNIFRAWFEDFAAEVWEEQIEGDVQSGKLDKLADKATKDFYQGRCTKL